jgi:hypothetical protein
MGKILKTNEAISPRPLFSYSPWRKMFFSKIFFYSLTTKLESASCLIWLIENLWMGSGFAVGTVVLKAGI